MFLPHFVHKKLIKDHVGFNFHQEKEALRGYLKNVFAAAGFPQYKAVEKELVGV